MEIGRRRHGGLSSEHAKKSKGRGKEKKSGVKSEINPELIDTVMIKPQTSNPGSYHLEFAV
jgi:hypothetical protein